MEQVPNKTNQSLRVIVRGGGDIATGSIYMLWKAGIRLLVLEINYPSAIRRQVAVSECIYDGTTTIEDMKAVQIKSQYEMELAWSRNEVPVLIDPEGLILDKWTGNNYEGKVIIDAILAKKNLGTSHARFPGATLIALGPGFLADPMDESSVDYVIETKRGHNLGRIITKGEAAPNSGIPGSIAGFTKERVIHASAEGIMKNICRVGDIVKKDQVIAEIITEDNKVPVYATIDGILRGLIRTDYPVTVGFKIADIDPRISELNNTFTISDKARCIGGSVLALTIRN